MITKSTITKLTRNDILFGLSLVCATWFALFGMVWIYWGAFTVAYPVGIVSLLLWLAIRNERLRRTRWIPIILIVGLVLSVTSLALLLIFDH